MVPQPSVGRFCMLLQRPLELVHLATQTAGPSFCCSKQQDGLLLRRTNGQLDMPTPADIHALVTTTDRPIADIAADLGLSVDALEKRLERTYGKRSRQLRTGSAVPQVGRAPSGRTTWQVRLTVAERAVVDAALVAGRAAGAKSDGEALAIALQRLAVTPPAAVVPEVAVPPLPVETDEAETAPIEVAPAVAKASPPPPVPEVTTEPTPCTAVPAEAPPVAAPRVAPMWGIERRYGRLTVLPRGTTSGITLPPVCPPVTEWQKARHDITGASATDDAWGAWTVTTCALFDLLREAVPLLDTPWWAHVLDTAARPECPARWRVYVERFDARLRRGGIVLTPPAKGSEAATAARFVREFGT